MISASASATPVRTPTSAGHDGSAVNPKKASKSSPAQQLTDEELAKVRQLQKRDREVRMHEMAHVAVGGDLVNGGASFEYETGPDGVRYAVAGEVNIDTSPGRTPQETLEKAERIKRAALAPADPSAQDRRVAAQASQMAMQARMALATQQRDDNVATTSNDDQQATNRPNYRAQQAQQAYQYGTQPYDSKQSLLAHTIHA